MSKSITQIGINGYEVVNLEEFRRHSILDVRFDQKPERCPNCRAESHRLRSKGNYERNVRHLEAFGRDVTLRIRCRRFQCLECRKSFVQPLPGIMSGRHSSEPFRHLIYRLHRSGISGKELATEKKLGSATVERIYQQFTQRKAAERASLICPQVLGIDEHSIHTKKRFATTLCDLANHRVFDVVEGRSTKDLSAFLMRLKGRDKVKMVCIDLSSPYRHLIRRFFPNAKIVADRFHVVRVVQNHFMTLFRELEPEVKNHRGYLTALRTKKGNLSEKALSKLRQLFAKNPALRVIYDQMQRVLSLLRKKAQTARQCRKLARRLLKVITELRDCSFKPILTLAETMRSWQNEIACMWRFTKSNGITEGFHRKMKLIQRRAFGFRNFENYRLRVIAECG